MENESRCFADRFLVDINTGKLIKDCMVNHFDEFTGAMEDLHLKRFRSYVGSCSCYLLDLRVRECEGRYYG